MKNLKTIAVFLALLAFLSWTAAFAQAQTSPAGSTGINNTAGTGGNVQGTGSGGNEGPSGVSNTGPIGVGVSNAGPAGVSNTGPAGVSNAGPSGVSNVGPSGGVAPTVVSGPGKMPSGNSTYGGQAAQAR